MALVIVLMKIGCGLCGVVWCGVVWVFREGCE